MKKVAIFTTALLGLTLILGACSSNDSSSKSDSSVKTETKSSSKKTSKKLTIKLDNSTFNTDANGKAKITGSTLPGTKVMIGYGIAGDNSEAGKDGKFSLDYELSDTDKTEIDINASLDSKSASAKATVTPSQEYIAAEAKKKDIRELSDDPTTEQTAILNNLADQQFEQQYPYKGSKIHSITGVIQPWTKLNNAWFYKAEATIVNAFDAKRDATIEIKITPTAENAGNVQITDY